MALAIACTFLFWDDDKYDLTGKNECYTITLFIKTSI